MEDQERKKKRIEKFGLSTIELSEEVIIIIAASIIIALIIILLLYNIGSEEEKG